MPLNDGLSFKYFERIGNHRRDRPHLFCTCHMFRDENKYYLITLPRLSKSVLKMLNPLDENNSKLTVESDRDNIHRIMQVAGFDETLLTDPVHDVYEGELNDKGLPHGQGMIKYANGDEFTGGFNDGKRHGHGVLYYANGNTYDGHWVEDADTRTGFVAKLADGQTFSTRVELVKFRASGKLMPLVCSPLDGTSRNVPNAQS